MKIDSIRIQSYKSFADSEWVKLSDYFTVLVGQNNSGKSAFLQALDVNTLEQKPHRSAKRPENTSGGVTSISLRVNIAGSELEARALGSPKFFIPTTAGVGEAAVELFFRKENTYEINLANAGGMQIPLAPSYGFLPNDNVINVEMDNDIVGRKKISTKVVQYSSIRDDIFSSVISLVSENIFVFKAERYAIGLSPMNATYKLNPDASNLPYMLLAMNRDHRKMELFQSLVSEVLPGVKRVLISAISVNVEISIQSHANMRGDLAVPLNECGTGVGQVLAILYVLVAYSSVCLIIDEPNSFLHPSATRRLLNVLRRFDRHQYVLSTHSSDVIATIQPETLLLLRWDEVEGETRILSNSGSDVGHIKASLAELGVELSDVFGFDTVAFVEGPTEAACFPLLVPPENKTAVNFVAMREASALTKRKPEELFGIYSTGVSKSALLPPKTRFSFDPDGRTPLQLKDVVRASKETAHFLEYPMFENYLLHPAAISETLRALDGERPENSADAIGDWIGENFGQFSVKGIENAGPSSCDAARLLDRLFSDFTDARWIYRKVEHGEALTKWILANDAASLAWLRNYVTKLVS